MPEGIVRVRPSLDSTAELVPRTSRGPRQGRHQVAIDHRGDTPVSVTLSAVELTEALLIHAAR